MYIQQKYKIPSNPNHSIILNVSTDVCSLEIISVILNLGIKIPNLNFLEYKC